MTAQALKQAALDHLAAENASACSLPLGEDVWVSVGPGWRPIETAPETGDFLVFMPTEPDGKRIQAASWHPKVRSIGNHFAFDMHAPTHWMPLPPEPIATPPVDKDQS